mmetsp:Transcript_27822/g.68721  ORF Transcript_27822/g.68721 Transcript_27822/m.68721 type:complete len:207 (+) Transcript_27822:262-882(+)
MQSKESRIAPACTRRQRPVPAREWPKLTACCSIHEIVGAVPLQEARLEARALAVVAHDHPAPITRLAHRLSRLGRVVGKDLLVHDHRFGPARPVLDDNLAVHGIAAGHLPDARDEARVRIGAGALADRARHHLCPGALDAHLGVRTLLIALACVLGESNERDAATRAGHESADGDQGVGVNVEHRWRRGAGDSGRAGRRGRSRRRG